MRTPEFMTVIHGAYCLTQDNCVNELIRAAGTLKWDQSLQPIIDATRGRHGVVIDAGAYIGDSTRAFIDAGFHVAAFEPQIDAFACLLRNCPEAAAVNLALGNGEVVLPYHCEGGNLGGRWVERHEGGRHTIRIDDLGLDVACIKLDVEGWEPNVLAGAVRTLSEQRPVVAVEFNPSALARAGFACENILAYFEGWSSKEIYRYGDENWDVLFTYDGGGHD